MVEFREWAEKENTKAWEIKYLKVLSTRIVNEGVNLTIFCFIV